MVKDTILAVARPLLDNSTTDVLAVTFTLPNLVYLSSITIALEENLQTGILF